MSTPTTDARGTKATIKQLKEFFEEGNGPKVEITELKALKKDAAGGDLPDYDDIAYGIGNGTLTY
jgi:hypothetical protein